MLLQYPSNHLNCLFYYYYENYLNLGLFAQNLYQKTNYHYIYPRGQLIHLTFEYTETSFTIGGAIYFRDDVIAYGGNENNNNIEIKLKSINEL